MDLTQLHKEYQRTAKNEHRLQHVLISATMTQKIEDLAKLSLQDPLRVDAKDQLDQPDVEMNVDEGDEDAAEEHQALETPSLLSQQYVVVPAKLRLVSLIGYLRQKTGAQDGKTIVFVSSCASVDFLTSLERAEHDFRFHKIQCSKIICFI